LIEDRRSSDECDVLTGSFLDGNIDGTGNIIALMSAAMALPSVHPILREDRWNGSDCEVVELQTPIQKMVAWILPSKANVIVKYLLEQKDPTNSLSQAEFEATALQNVDGRAVIRAGRCTCTGVDLSDGTKWIETFDAERTELNLHPQFNEPNLFTTHDVPNGVRVFLDDLPNVGLNYIWSGDGPVPKFDADMFDGLKTSLERTSAGEVANVGTTSTDVLATSGPQAGSRRISQLWIVLSGSSALLATVLILILVRRRSVSARR
jgi:hypothetical protein